jgi:hypothetical protein
MAESYVCPCAACRLRALKWPLLLIAAGVLFTLDLVAGAVSAAKTWPILLIVAGALGLAIRMAPDTGHVLPAPPAPPVRPTPVVPPPPASSSNA